MRNLHVPLRLVLAVAAAVGSAAALLDGCVVDENQPGTAPSVVAVDEDEESQALTMSSEPDAVDVADFNGTVLDDRGAPVVGASVTVNGVRAGSTDRGGRFAVMVRPADRFVINAQKAGLVPASVITDGSALGMRIVLATPERYTVDTRRPVRVAERVEGGGAVSFPENVVVDARGAPVSSVVVEIHSFPTPTSLDTALPAGDGSAVDARGAAAFLDQRASMYINLTDASGTAQYYFTRSASVSLDVPIAREYTTTASSASDTVQYDNSSGNWKSVVTNPALIKSAGLYMYYSTVVHAIGSYSIGAVTTNTGCVTFQADESTVRVPFWLKVFRSDDPDNKQLVTILTVYDHKPHKIKGIPNPSSAFFQAIRPEAFNLPIWEGTSCITGTECMDLKMSVNLPPQPTYLAELGLGNDATTDAYYAKIGASAKATLAQFRTANGFDNDPGSTVNFYNDTELGLGRSLTCRSWTVGTSPRMACTLAKYGHPSGAPYKALWDTIHNVNPGDTVTMEWSPLPGGSTNVVKFYAYGPDGLLKKKTPFDSQGEKNLPNVCTHCHGGVTNPTTVASGDLGSVFVPIESVNYIFSDLSPITDQWEPIRKINAMVRLQTATEAQSIDSYIDRMYPNGTANTAGALPYAAVPPSFVNAGKAQLYMDVVRPYCQLCHLSRATSSKGTALDWTNFDNMQASAGLIRAHVCPNADGTTASDMPNGFVPFEHFWQGGVRAKQLMLALGQPDCDVKVPVAGVNPNAIYTGWCCNSNTCHDCETDYDQYNVPHTCCSYCSTLDGECHYPCGENGGGGGDQSFPPGA